jgi:very-short-patch-repair endonuclease
MKYDFEGIKDHYEYLLPFIIKASERDIKKWASFDPMPLLAMMSPIEKQTWYALKFIGHAPMYPQYPVGKYFVDFGNPIVKVAIECDGKEFHQDKKKDQERDEQLKDLGWTIYRITGSEINGELIDLDEDNYRKYFERTIEGLIEASAMHHFGRSDQYTEDYQDAAASALSYKRS